MNCSLLVRGILQDRILEWLVCRMSSSRQSSQPRDPTWVSCVAGTTYCACCYICMQLAAWSRGWVERFFFPLSQGVYDLNREIICTYFLDNTQNFWAWPQGSSQVDHSLPLCPRVLAFSLWPPWDCPATHHASLCFVSTIFWNMFLIWGYSSPS